MENKGWTILPKISCTCITFDRPRLLEEAIQSFLEQDYKGEMEMVILNDQAKVKLKISDKYQSEKRKIKIYNIEDKAITVGAKRNHCTKLATGLVIFPWDDDDIHFKWRVSMTIDRMKNTHYWKPDRLWFMNHGEIKSGGPTITMAPSMAGYSKELFDKVGGYDHIDSGQDQTLENKFVKSGYRIVDKIKPEEIYYVYRFAGTGSPHLSSQGYGKGIRMDAGSGLIRVENLIPQYRDDYLSTIKKTIANMKSKEVSK